MILERVVIEDFKSIKKLNVVLHNLTCLIGKNESGKSAIIDAISFLNFPKYKIKQEFVNKNSRRYDTDSFPSIMGYFLLDRDDNEALELTIPFEFDEKKTAKQNDFSFKWLRVSINGNKIEDVDIDLLHGNNRTLKVSSRATGTELKSLKEKLFKNIIPHIELFNNDSLILNPITIEQLQNEEESSESFSRLFAIGGVKNPASLNVANVDKLDDKLSVVSEKITQLLQENYNQDKTLRVEVKYVANKFLLKFKDDSRRSYNINERSFGFQYFFAFLINKTFLNDSENRNIFLLDEPGVSLHPEGARDLIKIFENITKIDQIVYSTHNPFLAYRKKPDNLILVRKNGHDGTELITKIYSNKYQVLRKELGLMLNDSFLINDINLVVEGNSDKYLLHYVIHEDEELEPLTWLHIYSADTVTEIVPSVRYLNSLGLKGFVLMDADAASKAEIAKPKFKRNIIDEHNWDYATVNKIIDDDQSRTIEDLLPLEKYVEAYNAYYIEEADTIEWKKPFKPLKSQAYKSPIVDQVKKHFHGFADGDINKIAIFRKFVKTNRYEDQSRDYIQIKAVLLFIKSKIL